MPFKAPGVAVQINSCNSKLVRVEEVATPGKAITTRFKPVGAKCCSTYVSIAASCPLTCSYKDHGCYAQGGITGMVVRRLDKEAKAVKLDSGDVSYLEARAIAGMFPSRVPQDGGKGGGRPLRLHVAGDCTTELGAHLLDLGVAEFQAKGGGPAWTYTAAWRTVPRSAWGRISVLASVQNGDEALEAIALGYVPAIVVPRFVSKSYFFVPGRSRVERSVTMLDAYKIFDPPSKKHPGKHVFEEVKFLACPAETRGTPCVECRLCMDDDKLRKAGIGIAFESHGSGSKEVDQTLTQLKFKIKE